ncbi:hypothetical protein PVA45_03575 [Entomospira entomophila]|uniref:Uncharacterized protein n=1 Tax=Entomospira entomophila TaxID=2719988 RepID=A0A968KTQ8_9SPIO|nr:hypothetical protein [Entomospira entomophilus]NIZ40591.1 hypothetical protein [Entomospira entomophilus]WDI34806.1 hypothetical protein PVA45_03575 [Entomospira entomophilus]
MDVSATEEHYFPCRNCGRYFEQRDSAVLFCSQSCQDGYGLCINCHKPLVINGVSISPYCSNSCKVRYMVKRYNYYKKIIRLTQK